VKFTFDVWRASARLLLASAFTLLHTTRPLSAALEKANIPLCPGLTIVTAISQRDGDYESIKTIESIDGGVIRLKYSNERVVPNFPGLPPSLRTFTVLRAIRDADLRGAKLYLQQFHSTPLEVPGTTAIGTSSAVLSALKTQGEAELGMFDLPSSPPAAPKLSADPQQHPSVFDYLISFKLRRVESAPVMVALTVNGTQTELPAIHATGSAEYGEKGEFFFLDDESNPLALRWRLRIGKVRPGVADRDTLQVVKIAYRCTAPAAEPGRLERALAENGRVDVYEIYFSFNSDQIREESEPTLSELGDLLRRHTDWKLSIEGHTDSIASDAFNLDLSRRRAVAVKEALVTRFGIDAGRLTTNGFGKSRPRDTNETPEGRARNRRVELVRQP
jgi:outer membrane protein OmpA-like peptidoglycan-associated protein